MAAVCLVTSIVFSSPSLVAAESTTIMSLQDYLSRYGAEPGSQSETAISPEPLGETDTSLFDSLPEKPDSLVQYGISEPVEVNAHSRKTSGTQSSQTVRIMTVDEYLEMMGDTGQVDEPGNGVVDSDAAVVGSDRALPPVERSAEASAQAGGEKQTSAERATTLPIQKIQPKKPSPSIQKVPAANDSAVHQVAKLPQVARISADQQGFSPDERDIRITIRDPKVTAGPIDIDTAVRRAVSYHPVIARAMGNVFQQQEFVGVARAGYFPQLNGGVRTGYRESTGDTEESFTASASQLLYDFGKTSNAVEIQKFGVEREEASLAIAAEELARETANAFIEVQRHQALLQIAREQIEAIAELEALTAKRAAMGASTRSDEVQAKSRREGARATELQIRAQLDVWKRALQKLMGAEFPAAVSDAFPGALENACETVPQSVDQAPQILAAEAGRNEALASIEQARSDYFPTLSLNADYENFFNRSNDALSLARDDEELIFSLNITSNLFQGGARNARSRAAGHALNSATAARDQAQLRLSRALEEARDQARSLKQSLAVQDLRYGHIVQTQKLYRHQYLSLGTRTLLDILNTEQEIHQTRFDTQNTKFDLRRLQMECLFNVGALRETFRLNTNAVPAGGFFR